MHVTQIKLGDYLFTVNGWVKVTNIEYPPAGIHDVRHNRFRPLLCQRVSRPHQKDVER